MLLAPANSRSENIRVEAVIIPELELRNVQRHVLLVDLVERADNAAPMKPLESVIRTSTRI
jgi:hypothetical protein